MRTIAAHTGLRGVAALLVVVYHLQFAARYRLPVETATRLPARGYLAVDLFFMLSGFIISYTNRADRAEPPSPREAAAFLRARLARLYPLLFCSLAALVAVSGAQSLAAALRGRADPIDWSGASLDILLSQALLLNAWLPGPPGWNVASWSISAELGAYLLFPPAVAALARARRPAIAGLAAGALLFYAHLARAGLPLDQIAAPLAPLRCLAGFAVGMLLFLVRDTAARLPDRWLSRAQAAGAAGALAALALPVGDLFALPAFAALVVATWTDRGWLARALGARGPQWLGRVSYSIYLCHLVVLDAAGFAWAPLSSRLAWPPAADRAAWLAVALALVLATAGVTFEKIERPGRQWLARRLTGHRLPPIAAAPPAP